jgi:RNA polymerase sigma factor (sigma-70 family)
MRVDEFIADHYAKTSQKLIKRYAYRTGSQQGGEDVVHTAYERAIQYWAGFSGDDFDRWMAGILRNAVRDYMREERGQGLQELDEFEHEGAHCDGIDNKTKAEIGRLIEKEPPAHAEVLRLYYQDEYSMIDISRFTLNTYSNVNQIVRRFREELQKRYTR